MLNVTAEGSAFPATKTYIQIYQQFLHLIPDILQIFYLVVREYRAVFTGVIGPDPAMPALAYPA